ncbi:MAG TPA: IS91 family transposase, partial [Candidatus Handelsmanbacteria bacterium]|nr:IS91 family transposase [Candidatus Handelsmanbacteria bacterium]
MLEKLTALVPPPRPNLVRYHGVLAPNANDRAHIVPGPKVQDEATDSLGKDGTSP